MNKTLEFVYLCCSCVWSGKAAIWIIPTLSSFRSLGRVKIGFSDRAPRVILFLRVYERFTKVCRPQTFKRWPRWNYSKWPLTNHKVSKLNNVLFMSTGGLPVRCLFLSPDKGKSGLNYLFLSKRYAVSTSIQAKKDNHLSWQLSERFSAIS